MKSIKVKFADREIEVKKLPLGRYAELMRAIKELPKTLGGVDALSENDIFERLPELIASSLPDAINILVIATDLTELELREEGGLDDAIRVLVAVIEVNNYKEVYESVKKVVARQPAKLQTQTNG